MDWPVVCAKGLTTEDCHGKTLTIYDDYFNCYVLARYIHEATINLHILHNRISLVEKHSPGSLGTGPIKVLFNNIPIFNIRRSQLYPDNASCP